MLEVTTTGSRALGEVRHRLVDVFLWQPFPDGLQGDFQLISRLRLRLEFMILFQHGASEVLVQRVQNLDSFNEPGTVRLRPVLHDARTLGNGTCPVSYTHLTLPTKRIV